MSYSFATIGILSLLSVIGLLAIAAVIKDFCWITQHSIDFYVIDEPNSLSKALKVFKVQDFGPIIATLYLIYYNHPQEHYVNITFVYTHPKTRIKSPSTICRGFHISYECPKAKAHTLIKKLKLADGIDLELDNKTVDISHESGRYMEGFTTLLQYNSYDIHIHTIYTHRTNRTSCKQYHIVLLC